MSKRGTRRKNQQSRLACEVLEDRAMLTGLDLSFGLLDVGNNFSDDFDLTWDVESTPDGGGVALTSNDFFDTGWGLTKFDAAGEIDTTFGIDSSFRWSAIHRNLCRWINRTGCRTGQDRTGNCQA